MFMIMKEKKSQSWYDEAMLKTAFLNALRKFDPRVLSKNFVMFITAAGALMATIALIRDLAAGQPFGFTLQIALWLWFTVFFANFAEALAEGRGKAYADALKEMRVYVNARLLTDKGTEEIVSISELRKGDKVLCEAGDIIPLDGEVIEGIASVDESAITGESAPVIRESGGDRSAVTGGTRVISDGIVIRITVEPGHTFLARMISMVEGASRQKTPNETALGILLVALTIVFLAVVFSLPAMAGYIEDSARTLGFRAEGRISLPILVSLLACLIPTTIGGLLSAVGISGIDRLVRRNVLAVSGRAVEVAGDIDVLMLDKTGTITFGNRMANEFLPAPGVDDLQLAEAAQLASLSDETPEGRSIVVLAKKQFGIRGRHMDADHIAFIPFSASTRMSGVDIAEHDGHPAVSIRKGAAESVAQWVKIRGGTFPQEVEMMVQNVARVGGTPLVVARGKDVLGVIYLKDIVKGGIRERFARLRAMGIRTVMVTGDNALTAASIAAEAGVDDFLAEATEAGNMVDLDSNPTKLIEIVEIGKQMLITRGALTTFSFANDVAKYFAIIPAMFAGLFVADGMASGPLSALNIMGLNSPQSAILSTVIFNALVIVALIPLALKGVSYRPAGAASLLKRNILIYGVGGLIAPFMGIKLIDMVINAWRLV